MESRDRRQMEILNEASQAAAELAEGFAAEQTANERLIADRLDALEAEQVFHRALELEAEALDQPHLFTSEQLEAIADEINMDVAYVRQALGEIRLAPEERSRLDRLILPDHLMAVETIGDIDRQELDALIEDWMMSHEGLITAENLTDGTVWDVDRRWQSRLRSSQSAGGNRISRVAGGDVAHRVHSLSDDEHVVAMQSVGAGPLMLAKAGLLIAAAVFGLGAIGGLVGASGIIDFLTGMAVITLISGGIAGGAIAAARRWSKGITRALKRSLAGLTRRMKGRRSRGRGRGSEIAPAATKVLEALAKRIRDQRGAARSAAGRTPPPPPRRR